MWAPPGDSKSQDSPPHIPIFNWDESKFSTKSPRYLLTSSTTRDSNTMMLLLWKSAKNSSLQLLVLGLITGRITTTTTTNGSNFQTIVTNPGSRNWMPAELRNWYPKLARKFSSPVAMQTVPLDCPDPIRLSSAILWEALTKRKRTFTKPAVCLTALFSSHFWQLSSRR